MNSKENHRTENSSVSRKNSSDDPEIIEFDQDGVPLNSKSDTSKQSVPGKSTHETENGLKNVTSSGDLTVYHNGSRLHDQYEPMSATAALWLWFQGQERGCFGGDKVRDRFGPTMRSSQLDMIFEAVKRRRDLCGTVRLAKRARGVDADGNDWGETKVLLRGQSPVSKRKEFKTIFEHVRGNSVWPKETQHTYKALVQYLRSTMD